MANAGSLKSLSDSCCHAQAIAAKASGLVGAGAARWQPCVGSEVYDRSAWLTVGDANHGVWTCVCTCV